MTYLMHDTDWLNYAATMLRLVGFFGGVSLAARLIVGYRRLHKCVDRPISLASLMALVYSGAATYGSFTSLVLRVAPTWATLVYLFLTVGAVLGHRFIGAVYEAAPTDC